MEGFNSGDTISAREGKVFFEGEEVLNAVKFELDIEKDKVEIKRLGKRMTGHKTIGLSGTGSITEYHATSKWAKALQKFKDTGEDAYFDGVAMIEDKSSGRGSEKISIYGINIDSATIVSLDAEGDVIKDEIPFTIEDYNLQGSGLKDTF